MNEYHDRRSTNRVRQQLEQARSVGGWMPWAGLAVAVLFWAGVGTWLWANLGADALLSQPPLQLISGFLLVLIPGVALILGGFMARETKRSSEANAMVLTSARVLLEPADHAREEIASIAGTINSETERMNHSLSDLRSQVDDLRSTIETSVTSTLKASEIVRADGEVLTSRLSNERQSLSDLSAAIRDQSESIANSVPMHTQMLQEASETAYKEVQRADDTLHQRLRALEESGANLAQRIEQLDTMGAESRKRAQNLASALMRLDEQLVQSTRMVDSARQAGELASVASKTTADALRDATSDAIDAALKASETISARSAVASEEAQIAIARLQEMGVKAESTTRGAALAVRKHADETETRMMGLADQLSTSAMQATKAVEGGLDQARHRIEKASLLFDKIHEPSPELTTLDQVGSEPEAAPNANNETQAPKPTAFATPQAASPEPVTLEPSSTGETSSALFEGLVADETDSSIATSSHVEPQGSWAGLVDQPEPVHARVPIDGGASVLDYLHQGGVQLTNMKAADLKQIATASHRGERERRRAIRDLAPGDIQRVTQMLDHDAGLQERARAFLAEEEASALNRLAASDIIHEDAAPKLSAYLLLDAAIGVTS